MALSDPAVHRSKGVDGVDGNRNQQIQSTAMENLAIKVHGEW